MTRTVIALLGISGVGKSTLLRNLACDLAFQHLQASAIIKAARELQSAAPVDHDALRRVNIDDNQALLVSGFRAACDPTARLVVLDGHSVIDTPEGLVHIPPEVFAELGIQTFIFIADSPQAIVERRLQDLTRERPERAVDQIDLHQMEALTNTFRAARLLDAPLMIFSPSHIEAIRSALEAATPPEL